MFNNQDNMMKYKCPSFYVENRHVKTLFQNRRMKLKKELRAVKEINEQERKKRDEPGIRGILMKDFYIFYLS